jgi:hypothetical protein
VAQGRFVILARDFLALLQQAQKHLARCNLFMIRYLKWCRVLKARNLTPTQFPTNKLRLNWPIQPYQQQSEKKQAKL